MNTLAFVFAGLGGNDDSGRRETPRRGVPVIRSAVRSETDAQLAARVRDGEHAAFTSIFLSHYDGLCRFAEGYTHNAADAEEIVEGVFARVWERRTEFDPPGGIAAYLYASVRNRALNVLRDAHFRDSWEAEHILDMATDSAPGMSASTRSMIAELEQEELGTVLRRVIDMLPEHRRAVVTMRWFGGLSHGEIATALGTTANAVEIQLRRALKELAADIPQHLRE